MFWPTYSMTISSAAMGSMANRPHSWMRLRPKRSFFFRNYETDECRKLEEAVLRFNNERI